MKSAPTKKNPHGKTRHVSSYYAIRGWFAPEIQRVIRKWNHVFDEKFTFQFWWAVRSLLENNKGNGCYELIDFSKDEVRFFKDLAAAYRKLYAPDNPKGWVLSNWNWITSPSDPDYGLRQLITVEEIEKLIHQLKGGTEAPPFSADRLWKVAGRLKLLLKGEDRDRLDQDIRNRLEG